jgi:hypothetical protein
MISGDVHHYERHDVGLPDGRSIQCVISGGGGAFMTSTHQIPKIEVGELGEEDWTVYPTRADSLRGYSVSLQRKLPRFFRGALRGIPADEASAIMAQRHGLDLEGELARGERPGSAAGPIRVSRRSRMLARVLYPPHGFRWFSASRVSEALDWDEPPLFKNFMRMDLADGRLTMTAYGVTGLQRDVDSPAVIDRVEIPLRVAEGAVDGNG